MSWGRAPGHHSVFAGYEQVGAWAHLQQWPSWLPTALINGNLVYGQFCPFVQNTKACTEWHVAGLEEEVILILPFWCSRIKWRHVWNSVVYGCVISFLLFDRLLIPCWLIKKELAEKPRWTMCPSGDSDEKTMSWTESLFQPLFQEIPFIISLCCETYILTIN